MFPLQYELYVYTSMYFTATLDIKLIDLHHCSSYKIVYIIANIHKIFKVKWTCSLFYKFQYFVVWFELHAFFISWVLRQISFDEQVTIKLLIIKVSGDICAVWRIPLQALFWLSISAAIALRKVEVSFYFKSALNISVR